MAIDVRQKLRAHFTHVIKDMAFPTSVLKAAGNAMAAYSLDLIRERTNMGFDRNGAKFKQYHPKYVQKKFNYVAGYGSFVKKYKPLDRYAAEKVRDVGRLSGRFFAGMKYKNVKVTRSGSEMGVNWEIGLDTKPGPTIKTKKGSYTIPSPAQKADILKGYGYDIFGLATSGPFKKKEEETLKKMFKQFLRLNPGARGRIDFRD